MCLEDGALGYLTKWTKSTCIIVPVLQVCLSKSTHM